MDNIDRKMLITVLGKEYIGIGEYKISVNGLQTKAYKAWHNMLKRCYSKSFLKTRPTYENCKVCDEWLCYQTFAKWFYENYIEGYQLDKDILQKDNKIYSPETCCFVPNEINSLFLKGRGNDIKTNYNKSKNKYLVCIKINGKSKYFGIYQTYDLALEKYKIEKENYIHYLAEKHKNKLAENVYNFLSKFKFDNE